MAKNIQHVGCTSVVGIKAKPIIDIAVSVKDFGEVEMIMPKLNEAGFFRSKLHVIKDDILICDDDEFADTRSFHVHIVKTNSVQWNNYLNSRDYLNANPEAAKEYDKIKVRLAEKYPSDRNAYTDGKDAIVARLLSEAQTWACLHDIPFYNTFSKIEPITGGMSSDEKYRIESTDGKRYLLRVADIGAYN